MVIRVSCSLLMVTVYHQNVTASRAANPCLKARGMRRSLFKAYLLVRAHLSELVEISSLKQEIHPACLVLLLHTQSEPFFASVSQANAWLSDLRKLPPLRARDVAQLFTACLITTCRLEAMLDAFEDAHLGPFVGQVAEGQAFLDIASRAREIVERITSMIRAEEPQEQPHKEQEGARRHQQSGAFFLILLALLGFCTWLWFHRRDTHQPNAPTAYKCIFDGRIQWEIEVAIISHL